MSEAEYLALPEEKPYLEFVDGLVVQKAVANRAHGLLVWKFDAELDRYADSHGGEAGPERRVFLDRTGRKYRLPDTAYYAPGTGKHDDDVPTLAVEVRSPGESLSAQREKCRQFRENGVAVCWLVDPASRSVELFEEGRDGERLQGAATLESSHLPGFSLALEALFAVLDR
jgi:Uma2 family endonuclease